MASTEGSSGAAVSMKAEKANKESLAKKKSAIKAELEKTAAELEEIEQLKAEAEDLEDEEMLSEMQAEEQRLQVYCASNTHVRQLVIAEFFLYTTPHTSCCNATPLYAGSSTAVHSRA